MTKSQINALIQIVDAITDAVRAAGPLGCPEGTLYATLMEYGCTLGQFDSLIGMMVSAGRVRKEGHLLFA